MLASAGVGGAHALSVVVDVIVAVFVVVSVVERVIVVDLVVLLVVNWFVTETIVVEKVKVTIGGIVDEVTVTLVPEHSGQRTQVAQLHSCSQGM